MTNERRDLQPEVAAEPSRIEARHDTRDPVRFDVLGVPVSAIDLDDAVETIERWVREDRRTYVCVTGAHGVIACRDDAELRAIHEEAGLVTPDGMPLVWLAHRAGFADVDRVYGPDLMRTLVSRAKENHLRHFFYGGAEGVAEGLRDRLVERHPDLTVVGTHTPPFRPLSPKEEDDIIGEINEARPDVVWVGLSTPKQERWMRAVRGRLDAPVLVGVGAAFDFLSGRTRQAPPHLQRMGLEWLYRALTEPRRLGARYAQVVPRFVGLVAVETIHNVHRKYPQVQR